MAQSPDGLLAHALDRAAPTVDLMTATTTYVSIPVRLDVDTHAAGYSKAMSHLDNAATRELDAAGIEPGLRDLLRLRASKLNGCAYCVDRHHHDARAAGESEQRVAALPSGGSPRSSRHASAPTRVTDSVKASAERPERRLAGLGAGAARGLSREAPLVAG